MRISLRKPGTTSGGRKAASSLGAGCIIEAWRQEAEGGMAMEGEDSTRLSNKTLTTIIYGLYATSLLVGVTALAAIVMNYLKKADVRGTWLETHFDWQIRTFWFATLWVVIGFATAGIGVGMLILIADLVWYVYRIVKGWLNLNDNKPMYPATAPGP
jgi:uncharacterized membrane protein